MSGSLSTYDVLVQAIDNNNKKSFALGWSQALFSNQTHFHISEHAVQGFSTFLSSFESRLSITFIFITRHHSQPSRKPNNVDL